MKRNLVAYLLFLLSGITASALVTYAFTGPSGAPPSGSPGPIPVANGGTAAATTGAARTNLGAAASGANSDITSLTGLTTALTTAQGGTGANLTISKGDIILGAAAGGALTRLATSTNGYLLTASSTATNGVSWEAAPAQTPWTSNVNAAGFTLFGNSTVSGNLTLDSTSNATKGYVLLNPSGGNVGVGLASPGYKLDVVSGGGTTARFGTAGTDTVVVGGGSGKLDTGTVDPVYEIDGKKYATYLSGMTGVKEETTGVLTLDSNGKFVIDFAAAEVGSDAWLFYQSTDFGKAWENLSVIISSGFDGRLWYEKKPTSGQLVFNGAPGGEISYRLTAPRFDYATWSNIYVGGATEGLKAPLK